MRGIGCSCQKVPKGLGHCRTKRRMGCFGMKQTFQNSTLLTTQIIYSLKVSVTPKEGWACFVIPKEGLVQVGMPIRLLTRCRPLENIIYWILLTSWIIFSKSWCHTKRRMGQSCHTKRRMGMATCAHPSFGITPTFYLRIHSLKIGIIPKEGLACFVIPIEGWA